CFFFFQAEDGIRDLIVTGVQTCALPIYPGDQSANVSAATSPAEFDLNPKTVLMKGAHDPAFFISWHSQKDVVRALAWKSALMIWGGPLVTLVCVYILALQLDWL